MNIFDELISRVNRDNYPGDYDNGFTLAETISRLIVLLKEFQRNVENNNLHFDELKNEYLKLIKNIDELTKEFNKYKKGDTIPNKSITFNKLADDVKSILKNWVCEQIHDSAKFVGFGLDENGYFKAYIPSSWSEIQFDTSEDGRLILREVM